MGYIVIKLSSGCYKGVINMSAKNRWGQDITEEKQGLARRLKEARLAADLTMDEVGKLIGVSNATISRYEKADIAVPADKLEKLAAAYNVSPVYLMGWDEPKKETSTYDENDGYYINPQTAQYAEELRTNKDLRVLFSASRDLTKEQMQEAYNFIKYLKSKEEYNDN